jgi:hypothetical protein
MSGRVAVQVGKLVGNPEPKGARLGQTLETGLDRRCGTDPWSTVDPRLISFTTL